MSIPFKSGFVSIIGKPNAGKSTLLNQILGQKLCIVTPKASTTRHRIMGILSGKNYQMVFSDTPGVILPDYELHNRMMRSVEKAMQDADVIIMVAVPDEKFKEETLVEIVKKVKAPIVLAVNKIDVSNEQKIEERVQALKQFVPFEKWVPVSALTGEGVPELLNVVSEYLPFAPPFYDTEQVTDRPTRFFVSEIIREKIFLLYDEEVPYGCEVLIQEFKEGEDRIYIDAEIHVERQSQKGILIGKKGAALSKLGAAARLEIEKFLEAKVFLKLYVKVSENWKTKDFLLRNFGYQKEK